MYFDKPRKEKDGLQSQAEDVSLLPSFLRALFAMVGFVNISWKVIQDVIIRDSFHSLLLIVKTSF